MKPFDDVRMNYLRGKGSYSRPGAEAKKQAKDPAFADSKGPGEEGTDELVNNYKKATPGQVAEEQNFKVSIEGFPTMFIKGDSAGQIKNSLRKMVKKPDMIQSIERVPEAEMKKAFRMKAQGKEEPVEEEVDSTTSAARRPVKVKINGKEVVRMEPVKNDVQTERTLTKAELKKREEVAKAIERDNPNMPMDKKMAIATATAKKVSEMNFHQLRDKLEEELTPQQKAARLAMIKKSAKKFGMDAASRARKDAQRAIKKDKYLTRDMEEGVENIEELSRETLGSYVSKASDASKHRGMPTKKVDNRYSGVAKASKKLDAMEATNPLTSTHVKQGIGIARDKRYAGGNMTGAVNAMNKLHPKLASHPKVKAELQKQNEQFEEAVGTSAKYANKSGFMGGKYQSHDHMMTMKNFSSIRDKRQAQRDDEHKKQDPKMQKMGYAKHMVDTQKAKKKAKERGVDPSKTARSDYHNKNGISPNRKLPESKLQQIRDLSAELHEGLRTLRTLNEASGDAREIAKQIQSYAKKNGGIDRKHLEDMAKDMMKTGKMPTKQHMNSMDTDVRELVYGIMFGVVGEKGLKPYGIRMK